MDAPKQLELARSLVTALENGRCEEAQVLVEALAGERETMLFREVGRLTRELHEALQALHEDWRLVALSRHDIPSARERLDHVVSRCEANAAHSLDALQPLLPLSSAIETEAQALREAFEDFAVAPVRELRDELRADVKRHLRSIEASAVRLEEGLGELLIAKDQEHLSARLLGDLTQVIRTIETDLAALICGRPTPTDALSGATLIDARRRPSRDAVRQTGAPSDDEIDELLTSFGF